MKKSFNTFSIPLKMHVFFWVIYFYSNPLSAQYLTLNWANKLSASGVYDTALEIELYNNTHLYAIGRIAGTMDFDPSGGTYNLTSTGFDHYLAKYTTANVLVWAVDWGIDLIDVEIDNSGNAYALGYFSGTIDFDPGAATVNLNSGSGNDMVIIKMNSSGIFQWAKNIGSSVSSSMWPKAIELDNAGNIFTTGYFYGTQDFDPGAGIVNFTTFGGDDIFIAKYDNSGNYIWAKQIGSTSADEALDLFINYSGEIFIAGYFYGTVDFDPSASTSSLTSGASTCAFFAKYGTDGSYQFAKQILGTSFSNAENIIVDFPGNIIVTGNYSATIDFDPSAATYNITSVSGSADMYVAKYNAAGNFIWANSIGSTSFAEDIRTLVYDDGGNYYISGIYTGTVDFDPSAATYNLTSVSGDGNYGFMARYSPDGVFDWAFPINSNNEMWGIAVDASYNVYTTGYYGSTIDVDVSLSSYNLTVTGFSFDSYIAKYSQTGTILPIQLNSFEVENKIDFVQLNWSSSSEINADHYEILRSDDAINFYEIGKINAHVFEQTETPYQFLDYNKLAHNNLIYYKLKLVDKNQTFTFSEIKTITLSDTKTIQIYPNPISESFHIQGISDICNITIKKISGEQIYFLKQINPQEKIILPQIARGIYLLEIESKNYRSIQKILIQ